MSSKSGGAKRNTEGEKVIADNRKANYLFSIDCKNCLSPLI